LATLPNENRSPPHAATATGPPPPCQFRDADAGLAAPSPATSSSGGAQRPRPPPARTAAQEELERAGNVICALFRSMVMQEPMPEPAPDAALDAAHRRRSRREAVAAQLQQAGVRVDGADSDAALAAAAERLMAEPLLTAEQEAQFAEAQQFVACCEAHLGELISHPKGPTPGRKRRAAAPQRSHSRATCGKKKAGPSDKGGTK
jgi:hypothetical protein